MIKTNHSLVLAAFATLGVTLELVACKPSQPCPECGDDDEAEADVGMDVPPDTASDPCVGVDFNTDPNHCGGCGQSCSVDLAGTEWETRNCTNGVCGPGWTRCSPNPQVNPRSCAQRCEILGGVCVANGCAGHTAIFFQYFPFIPMCWPDIEPYDEFDGGCDEPLVTEPTEAGSAVDVMCCCGAA